MLYVQNANMTKGIEQVKASFPETKIRAIIIDFIESQDKGVIKGMI
jgi:hypothetical protein